MRETVIVGAVRTPVGKRNGGLSDQHAADLSAVVLNELVERTGVDPGIIDDVVWGCVSQVGDQSSNIDRLLSAWGVEVPTGQFAGDLTFAREVSSPAGPSAPFLGQMSFREEGLARGEVVTQGLDMVDMVFPGVVRTVEGVDVTVSPLILTTAAGNSPRTTPSATPSQRPAD